jgi:hypothetical protein
VTGRKANFTDVIGMFDKKASKEDVTILKNLMSSTDLLPMKDHTATASKTSSRFGGNSSRLKSKTVSRTSN